MKFIKTFASIMLLTMSTAILVNCKKDDPTPLTEQQEAAKKLSVTWGAAEILSAPVSGSDGTLENLTMTFNVTGNFQPSTFSASGAEELFLTNASSTWTWESAGSVNRVLLLNTTPVQELTIEELSETAVTFSFPFDGPVGGRVAGIGEYRVRMTRQ